MPAELTILPDEVIQLIFETLAVPREPQSFPDYPDSFNFIRNQLRRRGRSIRTE